MLPLYNLPWQGIHLICDFCRRWVGGQTETQPELRSTLLIPTVLVFYPDSFREREEAAFSFLPSAPV